MWTGSIILVGALICAILVVVVAGNQVAGDGKLQEVNKGNGSDIWKDLLEAAPKWGDQYDLNKDRDCGLQNGFAPVITMPTGMVGDLFAKQKGALQQPMSGFLEKGRGVLRDFFSKVTAGIKEKLDEAAGKVKNVVGNFKKKKTDAVKNVKAKLDRKSEVIEGHLKEASNKLSCDEPAKKCLEDAKGSFEEYQASLQQAMDPCLNEMKDAMGSHESRIDAAKKEVNDILTQLKSCSEGGSMVGGIKERLSAAFGSVQCTTKTLTNLMKNNLRSAMKKLKEAVKKAGSLKKEVDDANKCIQEPPKEDEVQKKEAKLVEKLKEC